MNTKINYLYRDACNYKTHNQAIFPGEITQDQKARILASLDDGEYFAPGNIGLGFTLPGEYDPEIDSKLCELHEEDFELTDLAPTETTTLEELTAMFEANTGKWIECTDTPW